MKMIFRTMESGCGSDNSDLSEKWDGVDGSGRRLNTFQGFLNWAIEHLRISMKHENRWYFHVIQLLAGNV